MRKDRLITNFFKPLPSSSSAAPSSAPAVKRSRSSENLGNSWDLGSLSKKLKKKDITIDYSPEIDDNIVAGPVALLPLEFSQASQSSLSITVNTGSVSLLVQASVSMAPPSPVTAASVGAVTIAQGLPLAPAVFSAPSRIAVKSIKEFYEICTPEIARDTLLAQLNGLSADHRRPEYPPALSNQKGCWLSQVQLSSKRSEYPMVRPLKPRLSSKGLQRGEKFTQDGRRAAQHLHWLSVRAWGRRRDLERLVWQSRGPGGRWEVSHLCDNPRCFRPDHLVVESHSSNERRKLCLGGSACCCLPKCI